MIDCAHVHAAVRRGESLDGSDIADHVATCPACAVLVAEPIVAHGLDATSVGDQGDLAALLARTKSRVAAERGWRASLRAKATPVRSAIGIAVVAAIPLLVLAAAPRADLGVYPIVRLVLEALGYLATAIAAAVIGLWPLHRAEPRTGRALAVAAAILAAVVVASLPAAHHDHPASLAGGGDDFLGRAFGCFAYGTICAVPTWIALRLLARDPATLGPAAYPVAVAVAGSGAAAVFLHCPIVHVGHRWAGHIAVLVLLLAWAAWRRWGRR
jgi:hypothetical protein